MQNGSPLLGGTLDVLKNGMQEQDIKVGCFQAGTNSSERLNKSENKYFETSNCDIWATGQQQYSHFESLEIKFHARLTDCKSTAMRLLLFMKRWVFTDFELTYSSSTTEISNSMRASNVIRVKRARLSFRISLCCCSSGMLQNSVICKHHRDHLHFKKQTIDYYKAVRMFPTAYMNRQRRR